LQSPTVQVPGMVQKEAMNITTGSVHTIVCRTLHIQF